MTPYARETQQSPWYSGEVHVPVASSTEVHPAASADPVLSVVGVWEDTEPPEDTLPLVETVMDSEDSPISESTDPIEPRPPTPSTEVIEQQLEKLPSDTRDYDYAVHSTRHPAAPEIVSRYRRFDAPDDASKVAQEMMASSTQDLSETELDEDPPRRKRRKQELSIQIESTRSLKWKPH